MLKEKRERVLKSVKNRFKICRDKVKQRKESYVIKKFEEIIPESINKLVEREEEIVSALEKIIERAENRLNNKRDRVEDLNPKNILKRGYSITLKNGKPVKESRELTEGDMVETVYSKGRSVSEIKKLD